MNIFFTIAILSTATLLPFIFYDIIIWISSEFDHDKNR